MDFFCCFWFKNDGGRRVGGCYMAAQAQQERSVSISRRRISPGLPRVPGKFDQRLGHRWNAIFLHHKDVLKGSWPLQREKVCFLRF